MFEKAAKDQAGARVSMKNNQGKDILLASIQATESLSSLDYFIYLITETRVSKIWSFCVNFWENIHKPCFLLFYFQYDK